MNATPRADESRFVGSIFVLRLPTLMINRLRGISPCAKALALSRQCRSWMLIWNSGRRMKAGVVDHDDG